MTTTVHLRCTQDAFVFEGQPTRNYGDRPKLSVTADADEKRVFGMFPIKSLPTDANVHSATLRLHLRGDWSGSSDITVQRVDEKWSERRITWNNQPTVAGATAVETIASGLAGDVVEVDVTTIVAASVERDKVWHGLRIVVDSTGTRSFHSSEVADHALRPHLVIEYSAPPGQPVRLRPRGRDAVNAAQPRLAWDAESQSELSVEVNATDDFGTPDYQSGWIVSDESGWDLSVATGPTFDAMIDGAEAYWRVKVKDEDGNESPWSNVAHFERHTYGTFDIVSPAADGNAVEESSPTIVTQLTGRTQNRLGWRLQFRDDDDDGTWSNRDVSNFETGAATADTSFELSRQSVVHRDWTYRVQVRVWDEYDRGTAVGERSYVQATRVFVYDPVPGVTATDSITATQPETGHPVVRVTWTRASAPDTFDIYVDGEVVDQQIDPGDAFVTGTTYQWDLWSVVPGEAHVFEVVATENHVDSTDNPTDTFTPDVNGLWVLCPEKALASLVAGHTQPNVSVGETGATYLPLNRRAPVRIIDTIRGLEGSVSGRIRTTDHGTADTMRHTLMRIKRASPETPCRLVLPFQNFPVILGAVTALPLVPPAVSEEYDVTIEFWQSGEFEIRAI